MLVLIYIHIYVGGGGGICIRLPPLFVCLALVWYFFGAAGAKFFGFDPGNRQLSMRYVDCRPQSGWVFTKKSLLTAFKWRCRAICEYS